MEHKIPDANNHLATLIADTMGVSEATAGLIAAKSTRHRLAANGIIYYQDDPATHLHILLSGYIRLSYVSEEGFVTLLAIVPPGRSFGESGLLDGAEQSDTASTIGKAEILSIPMQPVLRDPEAGPDIERALARIMSRRYRSYVEFTRGLYLPSLRLRLSNVLLALLPDLANSIRYKGQMRNCLGPIVNQRDLGSMARGTRENVNKTLRAWENDGIIALEDRHIIILDTEALEDIANGL